MNRSLLTLHHLFKNALTHHGDKKALAYQDEVVTYEELLESSSRVANALGKHGVGPNIPVALIMSNCMEFVISDMGLSLVGGTKVPLNDMLGENEIKYILQDSEAKVAIVGKNFFDIMSNIKKDLPNLELIVAVADDGECPEGMIPWAQFQENESNELPTIEVLPEDKALIIYTGGTTGLPKGVVHTQENMAINIFSHIIELELQGDERILLSTPLPHSAGMVIQAGIVKGAFHFIEKSFNPQVVIDRIEKDKVTFTFMVPTMIYRIMDEMIGKEFDLSSLRTILYGAAPITEERLKQGLKLFGPVFTQLYGQTEAPNFITRLKKSDHTASGDKTERLRSCGQPVMMSEVKIVDEMGNEVPPRVEGEITTKTPYNMIEYHQQPELTAESLKDGWLYTGDYGMKDEDGYIYLLDRKKDIVISGGMNVYTSEVENVIQTHPMVSQVAVIGVPDSDWGEAVMAVIIAKAGTTPTETEIITLCKAELSKYKCPKKVLFIDSLPLTPYGKIDKKALREPFWGKLGRAIN
ncbi:class I adenylate-forming enzyme family protein [Sporosarcina sp. CAU 1771]